METLLELKYYSTTRTDKGTVVSIESKAEYLVTLTELQEKDRDIDDEYKWKLEIIGLGSTEIESKKNKYEGWFTEKPSRDKIENQLLYHHFNYYIIQISEYNNN